MSDLISRQGALAKIRTRLQDWAAYGNEEYRRGLYACEDMIRSLPSADAVQGWIPCYERLPKTGDSVLVTYSDGEVSIVWGARPKAWVRYIESNNLIYPIAWMPLPEPYKGGDK